MFNFKYTQWVDFLLQNLAAILCYSMENKIDLIKSGKARSGHQRHLSIFYSSDRDGWAHCGFESFVSWM